MYPQNADDLPDRIRASRAKQRGGRAAWCEGTLELAAEFAEGRARYTNNQGFSYWLVQHNLDFASSDDRAAYIKLGQNIEIAREILEETHSTSVEQIVRNYADRLRDVPNTPIEKPVEPEVTLSPPEEAVTVISPPAENDLLGKDVPDPEPESVVEAPAPVAPQKTHSRSIKPSPTTWVKKYIWALGDEKLAEAFVARIRPDSNQHNLETMFSKILHKPGGRSLVREAAELLAAHPHWQPATGASKAFSPRCFHRGFGGAKSNGWPISPSGLKHAIAEALECERRVLLPPVHQRTAVTPQGTNVVSIKVPVADSRIISREELLRISAPAERLEFGEPFESPREDEDIVVYGTVIRRKGEKPEYYQRVWSMVRYMELFEHYMAIGEPKPGNRGSNYAQMGHFFRDAHGITMGLYWNQFAHAVRTMKDPEAGIQRAQQTLRLKA